MALATTSYDAGVWHAGGMRLVTLAAPLLVAVVSLTGCEQAEQAARDAAGDAACSAARSAADEAGQQVGNAVDSIGADPQAAERELSAVRDALAAAETGISGDAKAKIREAKEAVEALLGQAEDAAQGADIDTRAVDRAQDDLDQAVADIKDIC